MFSGCCMSTPNAFYQQWMPVLCVGGDTLDYSTIACFSMNTALTENVTDSVLSIALLPIFKGK